MPSPPVVQRLLQHHDGGPAVLEGYHDVVRQLDALVPGQRDVGQQWLRVPAPRHALPVRGQPFVLAVEHELGWVGQVGVGGIALVAAQVRVLLEQQQWSREKKAMPGHRVGHAEVTELAARPCLPPFLLFAAFVKMLTAWLSWSVLGAWLCMMPFLRMNLRQKYVALPLP